MKNRIISLFLLLFSTLPATAEYFRNLGLQNGLSQPSVLSIAQDGLGRMWFGTQEGINMYDGEQITYVKGEMVEEKISLLRATSPGISRLDIPKYYHGNEALHGVVRPGLSLIHI